MRISHRGRLTLTTSVVSGTILAGLFAISFLIFRREEINRAHDILRPAVLQIEQDAVTQDTITPDLGLVVEANPQLSFGTFDLRGQLLASSGALSLEPTFKWAASMVGKPTNKSGVEWGIIDIGNMTVVAGSKSTSKGLIVGVLPWEERERTMAQAAIALVLLWFPLVGLIGAITWIASAKTFKPLTALAEQAELFSESDLTRRLTVDSHDEYATFAARLNNFLDRLEDSVQRQKQFVEDAAHELRTPLTILRGRIETSLMIDRSSEEYRNALLLVLKVEHDGGFVLVTVTDEGQGVPVEKREAIFERFTRLEKSRNRSLGGFGVGLAVSKRLVEGRGGTIRVTDGPTGGARFEVRWPNTPTKG